MPASAYSILPSIAGGLMFSIIEQKADYTIGLKQNQPALYQDTEDYFKEYAKEMPCEVTLDQGHGRIEKRSYRLLTDIAWLEQKDDWCGLQALGMVTSTVTEKDETREYTRQFITSLTDIKEFADSVRKHWSIENQLHWCLDVVFREDSARARKDHSPLNMNVLRKTALIAIQKKYKAVDKGGKIEAQR